MEEIRAQQREHRERTGAAKRGRRPKSDDVIMTSPPTPLGPPPPQPPPPSGIIYIMESHPRAAPAHVTSSYIQFPRTGGEVHPHTFNNGLRYPSNKLPKIETVVSLTTPPKTSLSAALNNITPPIYLRNEAMIKEESTTDS